MTEKRERGGRRVRLFALSLTGVFAFVAWTACPASASGDGGVLEEPPRYGVYYDRYEPAYRYGYTLASDNRYTGKEWTAIEAEARRDWEKNNQGAWEDFKDAIRYAWDRVRGYSAAEASARSQTRAA